MFYTHIFLVFFTTYFLYEAKVKILRKLVGTAKQNLIMENLFIRRLEKDFLLPLPIVTGQGVMALSSSRGGLD